MNRTTCVCEEFLLKKESMHYSRKNHCTEEEEEEGRFLAC
jgi:hypothetical protein